MRLFARKAFIRTLPPPPGRRAITTLSTVDEYKQLRIYKNKTTFDLLFNYAFNKACQYDLFLNNVERMYNTSRFILGNKATSAMIRITVARIFTAGDSLASLQEVSQSLNSKGIGIMIDYCSEALPGMENMEQFFDHNAEYFIKSCEVAATDRGNSVAIKVSGLLPLSGLKRVNELQNSLDSLLGAVFDSNNQTTLQKIAQEFKRRQITFTETDLKSYVEKIIGRELANFSSEISLIEMKSNLFAWYIDGHELNRHPIHQQLVKFTESEIQEFKKLERRLESIFTSALENDIKIMVDAEQTYLQNAIDAFTQQYQNKFNKERLFIFNTIQNYLKSSKKRIEYEIERSRHLDVPFGLKLVRGAYMREEGKLANEKKYENPIHNSYNDTENNYHENILKLLRSMTSKDEILIASHNERTVIMSEEFLESPEARPFHKQNVTYAQLYGLADQITHKLLNQGYKICKYVPFGEMEIMIPYLLRRANETKDMLGSVHIQAQLIKHELRHRLH
eukprot:TRINITY_DN4595_c0_g2_i9.p1 TRINITY_DN4595_c0_g2~~TRINITY_DN4595_c0_g2_i9.p1  ORF type:complete len:507 (-),score=98.08 TRINITY_DN4595_c0_g2_i9:28-1548(-)